MSHRDQVYLAHVLECAERILKFAASEGAENRFLNDWIIQGGVIRELHILCESSQRLSDTVKDSLPDVAWKKLGGFRNVLVHEYLGEIDLGMVWKVVQFNLPELQAVLLKYYEDTYGAFE